MIDRVTPLPKFDSPPVIETALGVEFTPLQQWGIPQFGLFWNRIRAEFPEYSVHTPLKSQIEVFPHRFGALTTEIQLIESPDVRCWFFHSDEQRLIQVQKDRFIHNWRKMGEQTYPSYDVIKPKFKASWESFLNFLSDEKIGGLEVIQCEVTYINHIEIGHGWESMVDLSSIFPAWAGQHADGFLPSPEAVQILARFEIPKEQGRLHIACQPAIRRADSIPIIQVTLTARGAPLTPDTLGILDWFDLGHEWVVRGFADFTSSRMHEIWKRRS